MKTLIMLTLAAAITTSAAAHDRYFSDAQRHRSVDLAKVARLYTESLRVENDGVVRSALAHVTWMKLMCPEKEFANVRAQIAVLATSGATADIRYRAYLASVVYDRPALFAGEERKDFEEGDDMFASLAARVTYSLLEKGNPTYVLGK